MLVMLLACGEDRGEEFMEFERIGQAVATACPMADLGDVKARDACAKNLKGLDELYNRIDTTIRWGGHKDEAGGFDPEVEHSTTEFPAVTWAPTYLGQFMFTGEVEIRSDIDYVAVWLDSQWRTELPIGYLPYPFPHSAEKWDAHQFSTNVVLVFSRGTGTLVAAYRYGDDRSRHARDLPSFDGAWTWTAADGTPEPRVSMYDYVLSPGNPHAADLENAWYEAFNMLHALDCDSCHNPSDPVKMAATAKGLEFFNIPGQALAGVRERAGGQTLSEEILAYSMPPTGGLDDETIGIALPAIQQFEAIAEAALEFEDEARLRFD